MKYVFSALRVSAVLATVIEKIDNDIKTAKAQSSVGGVKVTEKEVANIVLANIGPVVKAITALFAVVPE